MKERYKLDEDEKGAAGSMAEELFPKGAGGRC